MPPNQSNARLDANMPSRYLANVDEMMIPDFAFHSSTRVRFGMGMSGNLDQEIENMRLSRVLVVTDKGVSSAGLLVRILDALEAARCRVCVFDRVVPNPRIETVMTGAQAYRRSRSQGLIALGGGSAMDTAKAIGVVVRNGGSIEAFEYGKKKILKGIPPLIAIPTTAGTGCEVTAWAVITDLKRQEKIDIGDGSSSSAPALALVDPLLTISMPPQITAATGMDALTHAIEAYTSCLASIMSDLFNIAAIQIIGAKLRQAVANGNDAHARSMMLYASMLAGIGSANSRVGLAHALAHKLGGMYDVPHGVANAILLPYVMQFNLEAAPRKFEAVAYALGVSRGGQPSLDPPKQAVNLVRDLVSDLRLPTLRELGVEEDQLSVISAGALRSLCAKGNARPASADDALGILEKAYFQDG